MESQNFDINKIRQDAEIKRQQDIADLESRSKNLYELVVTEKFTVDEVVAESYATSFTPSSEARFGGSSHDYRGGFTLKIVLKVSSDNHDVPVTTLNFEGASAVKAGDYISAQIPRFEEKRVGTGFYGIYKVFYFDRVFNSEESAIELALLSANGNVLRRDRAVNYKIFVRE